MREMAPDTQSFILDMHEAIGISDSAARLLNQARLGFADDGIAVVCSRIRDRQTIMGPLSKAARKDDRGFLVFEDNDLAVEWCENRLVRELARPQAAKRLARRLGPVPRSAAARCCEQVEAATRFARLRAGRRRSCATARKATAACSSSSPAT